MGGDKMARVVFEYDPEKTPPIRILESSSEKRTPSQARDLGGRIQFLREMRGWKVADLARAAAPTSEKVRSFSTILGRLESGEEKNPTLETILCIARALGCTVDELLYTR